jgi:hypothetical protein
MFRFIVANKLGQAALEQLTRIEAGRGTPVLSAARRLLGAAAAPSLLARSLTVFGAGVVVGAGLGLLFSPSSGAETRASLLGLLRRKFGAARGPDVVPSRTRLERGAPAASSRGGNGAGN